MKFANVKSIECLLQILTLRYHLFGMEASLKAFQSSKLLNNIPCTQKDALYIYEVLKQDAACRGHTYITLSDLRQHRQWNTLNFSVTNWLPALTFLSNNMITREERFNSKRNIFLYHNWKAEIDIADGLEKILHKGIQCGSSWNVDFSRFVQILIIFLSDILSNMGLFLLNYKAFHKL